MQVGFIQRRQIFANLLVKHCHLFCQVFGRHDLLAAGGWLSPRSWCHQWPEVRRQIIAAYDNEFPAYPNNGLRMVPAKVGYGLVGGRNTVYQPHHFDVAPRFLLDHAA